MEKYCTAGKDINGNMMHAYYMLKIWGLKNTQNMCYSFPTATIVVQMRLDVTL